MYTFLEYTVSLTRRMENPPVDRAALCSVPANEPTPTHKLGRSWFPRGVGCSRGSNFAGGIIVVCLAILCCVVVRTPLQYQTARFWLCRNASYAVSR